MRAKISPPLRDKEQQAWLWRGLLAGKVNSIGSDHVPFLPKKGVDLWTEFPASWPSLGTAVDGHPRRAGTCLTLQQLTTLNSYEPSRRFGLYPRKGSLEVGTDADLVLVDLDEERAVRHEAHGTCIYEGWSFVAGRFSPYRTVASYSKRAKSTQRVWHRPVSDSTRLAHATTGNPPARFGGALARTILRLM